jgi:flagellar basal-body rod modification protein FlgD
MATTSSVTTTHTPATSLDPVVQKTLDGLKTRVNKASLTADDFLRLLTVQLQNQDPLKPMEDAQFMGQMAQFASLEQTRDLNTSFANFTKQQSTMSAAQFLGMEVSLNAPDGKPVNGVVTSVNIDSVNGAMIVVGGTPYATSMVTNVRPPTLSN